MDKLKLRQAIVVEGKYDQNTLRQLVDTAIFTTNGFADMKDPALLRLLQQAAQTTGLVILGFSSATRSKARCRKRACCTRIFPIFPAKKNEKQPPEKKDCSAWRA